MRLVIIYSKTLHSQLHAPNIHWQKKTKKKWWATNDRRKPYWCCV